MLTNIIATPSPIYINFTILRVTPIRIARHRRLKQQRLIKLKRCVVQLRPATKYIPQTSFIVINFHLHARVSVTRNNFNEITAVSIVNCRSSQTANILLTTSEFLRLSISLLLLFLFLPRPSHRAKSPLTPFHFSQPPLLFLFSSVLLAGFLAATRARRTHHGASFLVLVALISLMQVRAVRRSFR